MGLLNFFSGFASRNSSYWTPDWLAAAGGWPTRDGELPTPAESIGIDGIYQSINLLTDPIVSQPLQLRADNPAGGSHQIKKSDVARALAAWPLIDKEKFIFDTLVNGNGFAVVRRNGRGGVEKLETVGAHRVTVGVDFSGEVWFELAEDMAINAKSETVGADNMVHLKYRAHSAHTCIGMSPLITLAPSLERVTVINKTGIALFKNFASPGLILSTPKRLGPEAAARLKDQLQAKMTGKNQGKTLVLDNDMKPQLVERALATEMQLAELDSINIKSLSRVYGVPAALLGESGATAYNSSVELIRSYHSLTLKPFARRVGDCLSQVLLSAEDRAGGMHISIDMASLIRGEGVELADYLSKLTNSGILAVNESRQMVGLEDVVGGDMLRSPVNVMPIDTWQDYAPGSTGDQPAPSPGGEKSEPLSEMQTKFLRLSQVGKAESDYEK